MGLKQDRETLIDEWGDYPPEAQLYLIAKCAQRRYTKMGWRKKLAVSLGIIAVAVWAVLSGIAMGIPSWPLALFVGVVLGAILLYIALLK